MRRRYRLVALLLALVVCGNLPTGTVGAAETPTPATSTLSFAPTHPLERLTTTLVVHGEVVPIHKPSFAPARVQVQTASGAPVVALVLPPGPVDAELRLAPGEYRLALQPLIRTNRERPIQLELTGDVEVAQGTYPEVPLHPGSPVLFGRTEWMAAGDGAHQDVIMTVDGVPLDAWVLDPTQWAAGLHEVRIGSRSERGLREAIYPWVVDDGAVFPELKRGTNTRFDLPYVLLAHHRSWLHGYPDGSFRPNQPVNRAEWAAILARIAADTAGATPTTTATAHPTGAPPTGANPHPFRDVPADAWYAGAVALAYQNGWIRGVPHPDGLYFEPDRAVTMEEMALIVAQVWGWTQPTTQGDTVTVVVPHESGISPWARDAVDLAIRTGIYQPITASGWHNRPIQRNELAIILTRLMDYPIPTPRVPDTPAA